jgi:glycosyltransferase involved in cell wall biosynthesis
MTSVAMVTPWGVACGVDNYVRELVQATKSQLDVIVCANQELGSVDTGADTVLRDWNAASSDVDRVQADLLRLHPDIVHIQFSWGYMQLGFLGRLLSFCEAHGIPSIVQLHATYDHPVHGSLVEVVEGLRTSAAVIVHGDFEVKRLAEWGVIENVVRWRLGEKQWPRRDVASVRGSLGISDRFPVVATFGFLQRRKRTLETIRSLAVLREDYPGAYLVAATAIHPRGHEPNYYLACREEIRRLGLTSNVEFIVRYLPEGAAMLLLQAADVIVLPYSDTPEGTSAAAKFCSAAGRPLVVSGEPLFDDYRDSALTLSSVDPVCIAETVAVVLKDQELAGSLATKAWERGSDSRWDVIASEYVGLVRGLSSTTTSENPPSKAVETVFEPRADTSDVVNGGRSAEQEERP